MISSVMPEGKYTCLSVAAAYNTAPTTHWITSPRPAMAESEKHNAVLSTTIVVHSRDEKGYGVNHEVNLQP